MRPVKQANLTIKRRNYRKRAEARLLALTISLQKSLYTPRVSFYLPPSWSFTLLKYKNRTDVAIVYLTSPVYFFRLPVPLSNTSFRFDVQTSVLTVESFLMNNYLKLTTTLLTRLLFSFSRLFFNKIKFKGKGYYIFKNSRNTITPQFGHAHRIYCYAYNVSVKFLTKTTILVYGISSKDVLRVSYEIKRMRPINIFTGRGVRFAKQVVYKKTGKVSSYR